MNFYLCDVQLTPNLSYDSPFSEKLGAIFTVISFSSKIIFLLEKNVIDFWTSYRVL